MAFVEPFQPSRAGTQFIGYNTFYPSFDGSLHNLLSFGWLQISNEEDNQQSGEFIFYNSKGEEVRRDEITLAAGQRRDIAVHELGANLVA